MKLYRYIPPALLLTGLVYRAAGVLASAIWYDEAVSLYRTTLPFWTLAYDPSEYSGCLFLDLVLRPLMALSPHSLFLLRLPSLLASFGCLWLTWLLMRRLQFTPLQQTLTAALAAFLPGMLWMAQDARVYSILTLLALAGLYFAIDGRWLGLAACAGLMLYTHNTAAALAGVLLLIGLALHRQDWKRYAAAAAIVFVAGLPVAIRMLSLDLSDKFWALPFSFWRFAFAWLEGMLVWTTPGALALIPMVLLGLTLLLALRQTDRGMLFFAWAVPLFGLQVISGLWQNVIIYRTMMPLVWFFLLWLGYELGRRPFRILQGVLLAGWALALVLGFGRFDPATRGGGIDQAAAQIRAGWQPGDRVFYTTNTAAAPFSFYLGDLPADVWDGVANVFVTPPGMGTTADLPQASRIWIVTPGEPLIRPDEQAFIDGWLADATLITQAQGPEFAAIYVYLKGQP
jgi:hypothetical protein